MNKLILFVATLFFFNISIYSQEELDGGGLLGEEDPSDPEPCYLDIHSISGEENPYVHTNEEYNYTFLWNNFACKSGDIDRVEWKFLGKTIKIENSIGTKISWSGYEANTSGTLSVWVYDAYNYLIGEASLPITFRPEPCPNKDSVAFAHSGFDGYEGINIASFGAQKTISTNSFDGYLYTWDVPEGIDIVDQTSTSLTYIPRRTGNFTIKMVSTTGNCVSFSAANFEVRSLCTTDFPLISLQNVEVYLDNKSGFYYIQDASGACYKVPMHCFTAQATAYLSNKIVNAQATYFDKNRVIVDMSKKTIPLGIEPPNVYESRNEGYYFPIYSANYKSNPKSFEQEIDNKSDGTFSISRFNWENDVNKGNGWVSSSKIDKVDQYSSAVVTHNPLNIYSVNKFDQTGFLVSASGVNVESSDNLSFESFESRNISSVAISSGWNLISEEAFVKDEKVNGLSTSHSGATHYNLSSTIITKDIQVDEQLKSGGFLVQFWAPAGLIFNVGISDNINQEIVNPVELASSGSWSLYEAFFNNTTLKDFSGKATLSIENSQNNLVIIDDIKTQPYTAEVSCYVYDYNNLRLKATFDNNHFATFFHYNVEGKLIRKSIETERGIQTLQENFYNLQTPGTGN
ncbi:hypothetical protein [Mangrovivirga cuniculi]|uniref:PKD domain-containing protein n=1 Tax=Mangrovivirga cuniculi TaxID=2715131 RepID=A0A4D7JQH6_9BACT|nr:hypothetical protein [Mangrovivirga cuniculi]QCK13776.1 hypothetical protein DCC35_02885 [Mangrovivirga cuniculi]